MIFMPSTLLSSGGQLPNIAFLGEFSAGTGSTSASQAGLLVLWIGATNGSSPVVTVNGVSPSLIFGSGVTEPQMGQLAVGAGGLTINANNCSCAVYLLTNLISNSPTNTASGGWGVSANFSTTLAAQANGVAVCGNWASAGGGYTSFNGVTGINVNDTSYNYIVGYIKPTATSNAISLSTATAVSSGIFYGASWR